MDGLSGDLPHNLNWVTSSEHFGVTVQMHKLIISAGRLFETYHFQMMMAYCRSAILNACRLVTRGDVLHCA